MEANLIYIREEELTLEFQEKLNRFKESELPIYIVVQLKSLPHDFQPLLTNINELRTDKVKSKITDWLTSYFVKSTALTIQFVGGAPNATVPFFDFNGLQKLFVYSFSNKANQLNALLENVKDVPKITQHRL